MSATNWCDYCGKSNIDHIVHWYYSEELGEIALCNRHAKQLDLTANDLIDM
jgi:hypothetical protein